MPIFEYRGLNQAGKNLRGTIDAENLRTARAKLKKDGIFVVDLKDKGKEQLKNKKKSGSGKKISIDELSMMTRQLATLIKAKIPLVEALAAVSDQVENETLKEATADIKNLVNEGATFYKSLSKYPKLFDHIYVTMCEAGEATGNLDVILVRLAEFKEAQNELNSKVKSAILYPAIMFIFTLAMLAVIFIFVIPKLTSIFESAEMELPWYTLVVINFSGILVNYWHVILVLMFGAYFSFQTM